MTEINQYKTTQFGTIWTFLKTNQLFRAW